MASENDEFQGHEERGQELLRQERGAIIFAAIAVLFIMVMAIPCCLYFGAGLFMGLNQFQTGQYTNPARAPQPEYKRDPKYDRSRAPARRRPEDRVR